MTKIGSGINDKYKIINKCVKSGCVKYNKSGFCFAFEEPLYQWRNGKCFGITTDISELENMYCTLKNILDNKKYKIKLRKETEMIKKCIDYHKKLMKNRMVS